MCDTVHRSQNFTSLRQDLRQTCRGVHSPSITRRNGGAWREHGRILWERQDAQSGNILRFLENTVPSVALRGTGEAVPMPPATKPGQPRSAPVSPWSPAAQREAGVEAILREISLK